MKVTATNHLLPRPFRGRVTSRLFLGQFPTVNDFASKQPCGKTQILNRVDKLSEEGRTLEAKRLILANLSEFGETPALLWRLADIEDVLGNKDSAAKYLHDASKLAPENPEVLFAFIRALYRAERYAEAKAAIKNLTPELRQSPWIRAMTGDIYRLIGWPAHAAVAYGGLFSTPLRSVYYKIISWIACGAPFNIRHSSAWLFECIVEDNWNADSARNREVLSDFQLPPFQGGQQLVDELDTFLLMSLTVRLRLRHLRARSYRRPGMAGCLGFAWITAFVSFYAVEKPVEGLLESAFVAIVFAEITTIVISGITNMLNNLSIRGRYFIDSRYLWILAVLGILELWNTGPTPLAFLWILLIDVALTSAVWMGQFYKSLYLQSRLRRDDFRWFLTDRLLYVLKDVTRLSQQSWAHERARWISELEEVTWVLEEVYPRFVDTRDRIIRAELSDRARGAASYIRSIASTIAAPVDGSWSQVTSDLKHAIYAIISGEFGNLKTEDLRSLTRATPRFNSRTVALSRLIACLLVIAISIWVLWWTKDRQDIANAVTAVFAAVATGLTALLFKTGQKKDDNST
jgi:hypothetical protein